ncbi:FAD-dependent monooxygenase [Actinomadura kijaniata]|uniref:FAD-dependent monooxygenase n=1 Tax=Actinomadura kijaniata TaxID=46161 RepID=UPI002FEA6133
MDAIVIGGGIGGLAAALALHRGGHRVRVLERAPAFTEVGAGLALQPNALRALDALGLGDTGRGGAAAGPPAGIRRPDGAWLVRNDVAALERRFGRWAALPRAALLSLLLDALPADAPRPGVHVHEVRPDGTVTHGAGTETADLVVGADGLNSAVRRSLWPDAPPPRYAGYTTWRAIVPGVPVGETVETWGRGERFGYARLADGRAYCYAMVTAPRHTVTGIEGLRRRFAGWHDPIPALLAAATDDGLLQHDTYELPDLPAFTAGRVALIGDAAHAMTPNLGQGACQALEDAVVLGRALGPGAAVPEALRAYDRERRPRAQGVARRSRRLGAMAQRSAFPLVGARNAAMRAMPAGLYARSLEPVLGWGGRAGRGTGALGSGE